MISFRINYTSTSRRTAPRSANRNISCTDFHAYLGLHAFLSGTHMRLRLNHHHNPIGSLGNLWFHSLLDPFIHSYHCSSTIRRNIFYFLPSILPLLPRLITALAVDLIKTIIMAPQGSNIFSTRSHLVENMPSLEPIWLPTVLSRA